MSTEQDGTPCPATKYESIVLTLTQDHMISDELSSHPIRSIRFTASKPKIQVGRSSKTISKGLSSGPDNAVFDSPVMSRAHAEIKADLNEGAVYLKDLGSLHGTTINKSTLVKELAFPLKTGDSVCFGMHVARGLEVFNPATVVVDVALHKPAAERPRAFRAPEPTDEVSDGGSECDCSDSDDHLDTGSTADDKEHESDHGDAVAESHTPSKSDRDSTEMVENKNQNMEEDIAGDSFVGSLFAGDNMVSYDLSSDISEQSDLDDIELDYGEEEMDESSMDDEHSDEDMEDEEDGASESGAADEDMNNFKVSHDDSSEFLSAEITRYCSLSAMVTATAAAAIKAATPAAQDRASIPADGLCTPPSASHASPWTEEEHTGGEESTAEGNDRRPLSDDTPVAVSKKCNISSILNPSPPPSSPFASAIEEVMEEASVEIIDGMDPTDVPLPRLHALGAECSLPELVGMAASAALYPTVMDMHGTQTDLGGFDSIMNEAADKSNSSDTSDVVVPVFNCRKSETSRTKRKADEMLADEAVPGNQGAGTLYATGRTDEAPAKRQATVAAMQAGRGAKAAMWAVAEKIGIAALGGAMVLGTLIYTAPVL